MSSSTSRETPRTEPENAVGASPTGDPEKAGPDANKNSGLFESMVAPLFEEQADGSVLFYPHGSWSRTAYRMTDPEHRAEVRASVKRFQIAATVGGGALGGVLQAYVTLVQFLLLVVPAVGAVSLLGYRAWVHRATEGCEAKKAALSFREQARRQAQAMGRGQAWFLAGTNLVLFLVHALLGGMTNALEPGWAAVGLLLFGGGTLLSAFGLYLRRASPRA